MEARRNRLRLLAYRRGLLAPDYKYGAQSKVREELLLFAVAREENVRLRREQEYMANILLAPNLDPKKFGNYMKTVYHVLSQLSKREQYSMDKMQTREDSVVSSMSEMIKVWNKLEENGTLAKWQKMLEGDSVE